ncbi:hypothetical protein ACWDR1_29450 [Streptosporangium sandarakinum]
MLDSRTRERLEATVRDFNAQLAEIRDNPQLSELGKREQIRELYDQAKPIVEQLRAEATKTTQTTVADLERRLFGLADNDPTAVISYRDAVDRVAAIKTPTELGEVMERAHRSGDATLLRAGFHHAFRKSRDPLGSDDWQHLVNEYVEHNPDAGDDLAQLQHLTSPRGKTAQFAEMLATSIARPKELDDRHQPSDQVPETHQVEHLTR